MPSLAWRASHGGCCAFAGPSVFGARTSARGCMNSGAVSQARNRFRIDGSPSRSRRAGYRCWRYESASLRIPASSACGSEPCLRSSLLRQAISYATVPPKLEDVQRHLFVVHAGQLQAAKLTLTGPKCRTVTVPCESFHRKQHSQRMRGYHGWCGAERRAAVAVRGCHRTAQANTCFAGLEPAETSSSLAHAIRPIDPRRPTARSPCCE